MAATHDAPARNEFSAFKSTLAALTTLPEAE